MKKLIYLLAFSFMSIGLSASHMAGGEIWYEFTGDASNPYKYRVWLQFYRDVSGIPAPTNPVICVTSSCYSSFTSALTFAPFILQNPGQDTSYGSVAGSILTPDLDECVDKNSGGTFVQTEIYRFYTDITLNGNCSDWSFSFGENARNANDNLATGGTFYIEAKLNNTLGPNSSPVFVNPAAKSFCVGSPFVWSQAAIEPDGKDSLYFNFGMPQNATSFPPACPLNPQAAGFSAGYSITQPMSTVNGITINHKNGTFNFTPSQPEVVVINVTVTEYRYDTISYAWLINGTSVRDLQVPIMSQCKSEAAGGPKLDFSGGGIGPGGGPLYEKATVDKDSITNYMNGLGISPIKIDSTLVGGNYQYEMGVINYNCFDTSITMTFNIDVLCESFSAKADEFRLISGTDTIARPIVSVDFQCKTDLTVRTVKLRLHKALDVNGDYYLQIQKGSDGNTITNRCGFEIQEFYTMIVRVKNCPILDYKVENVSVSVDQWVNVDWWVDPQYFRPQSEKLFNKWQILRATGDDPFFYVIDELNEPTDITRRSYIDTSLEMYNLDQSHYRYQVQLVQNGIFRAPTSDVRTILLTDTLNNDSTGWDLYWTHYDGWTDPSYEAFVAKVDTTIPNHVWESIEGPKVNFFESEFLIPVPLNSNTAGLYVCKVEATDPQNLGNPYYSESNWIYFDLTLNEVIPPDGPPPAATPNVFTPNKDGNNDLFYVYAEGYTNAYIEVYNRWGTLVWRDSETKSREALEALYWNGTDVNSGAELADGVYYYVVNLRDDVTGETENLTGQVNIFKR